MCASATSRSSSGGRPCPCSATASSRSPWPSRCWSWAARRPSSASFWSPGILPQVLFVLVGGVWADRLPRRTIMIAADAVRALVQAVTAVLLLSGEAQIWQLAVLYALHATASAFFNPAATALVPQVTPRGSAAAGQRAARHDAQPRGRPGRGARRHPREPGLHRRGGGARRLHIRRSARPASSRSASARRPESPRARAS